MQSHSKAAAYSKTSSRVRRASLAVRPEYKILAMLLPHGIFHVMEFGRNYTTQGSADPDSLLSVSPLLAGSPTPAFLYAASLLFAGTGMAAYQILRGPSWRYTQTLARTLQQMSFVGGWAVAHLTNTLAFSALFLYLAGTKASTLTFLLLVDLFALLNWIIAVHGKFMWVGEDMKEPEDVGDLPKEANIS
ncbi:hypothetical protein SISSUDRAFT_1044580 [Sistotremastrum suecicum HHB10207 ss-3]|uniref:Uncharacterized protein n=1 Tax=Sistotremastrum suecicum HHB10207 ss-3 TaxID=1314776 RepID=A0A166F0N6_9AGAM|nr:hypothetical protein SISSUDRAFT_1044580 [Sistotremastrum suecicum HHB10207 ss-3]